MKDRNNNLGALFGKAKQWAKQELKNSTTVAGTPMDHRRDERADAMRLDQLERDAERARDEAIAEALLPQSIKDYRDQIESSRLSSEMDRANGARSERALRVSEAWVTTSGALSGSAQQLAVQAEPVEFSGGVIVTVEAVDPVPMAGGTFCGFTFEIPNGAADGSYPLVSDDLDAMQYSLFLEEDHEGWSFHPSYGPGTITVSHGVAAVDLTFGSAGSEVIHLQASVPLPS